MEAASAQTAVVVPHAVLRVDDVNAMTSATVGAAQGLAVITHLAPASRRPRSHSVEVRCTTMYPDTLNIKRIWFCQDEHVLQHPAMRPRPAPSSPVQAAQPKLQVRYVRRAVDSSQYTFLTCVHHRIGRCIPSRTGPSRAGLSVFVTPSLLRRLPHTPASVHRMQRLLPTSFCFLSAGFSRTLQPWHMGPPSTPRSQRGSRLFMSYAT